MLPGPVTRLTGSQSRRRRRRRRRRTSATAWAPPTAYTSSTPSRAQAARIVGWGSRPAAVLSRCGGLATARRADAGDLGRDDVHDDAARVDGQAAGHVEADPVDRHPALGDRAAVGTTGSSCRCAAGRRGRAGPGGSTPRGRPARPGRAVRGRAASDVGRAPAGAAARPRRSARRGRAARRLRDAARPRRSGAPAPGPPRRRTRHAAARPAGRARSSARPRRSRVDIMASSLGSAHPRGRGAVVLAFAEQQEVLEPEPRDHEPLEPVGQRERHVLAHQPRVP